MRTSNFTMLLIVLFFLLSHSSVNSADGLQKVTVRVDGLACPFCAYGLEKKLKKIAGLEKLDIKINEGVVILHIKAGTKIDKDLITKKVKAAGFTPGKVQVDGKSKQESKAMQDQKTTLGIKGMSCEGCVSRVKNALTKLDCVRDVEVDLSTEKVSFLCTDNKINPDKFVEAIEALGFKAELAGENHQKKKN